MIRRLCKDCKHNDENGFCNDCGYFYREMTASGGTASDSRCDQATRKTTNADRIRAMTDEELAQLLRDYECNRCDWCGLCDEEDKCEKEIMDWLKQEADNPDCGAKMDLVTFRNQVKDGGI